MADSRPIRFPKPAIRRSLVRTDNVVPRQTVANVSYRAVQTVFRRLRYYCCTMIEPGVARRDFLSLLAGAAVLPAAAVAQVKGPLHYLSLANVARLIAARELQSTDLTRQLLDRIAALDGRLQSYVTACYGSLTSFNVLFAEEKDRFSGASGE